MNSTKSSTVKEKFCNLQVSINSVNNCLNDVQFFSLVVKSCAREYLDKLEDVEDKIVDQMHSTKGLITDLATKFDKVHISKSEKLVPTSFLYKRNIQI